MWSRLDKKLRGLSRWMVWCVCVLLFVFVMFLDYETGYELAFSLFYLVPVWIAGWYNGLGAGIFWCAASAVVWALVDVWSGHVYSNGLIIYWNCFIRFSFFAIIVILLAKTRQAMRRERLTARRDALTGLLNRRALGEKAARLAQGWRGGMWALGYIDLDHFKEVNDTLGHAGGDRVLERVAKVLMEGVRERDLVARVGGDEFAVLLVGVGEGEAEGVFERLRGRVEEEARREGWPIGASVGVVLFEVVGVGMEEAMGRADGLMYRVKAGGKNGVRVETLAVVGEAAQAA